MSIHFILAVFGWSYLRGKNFFLAPALSYVGNKTRVKFNGSWLKEDKITFTHETIKNIYILSYQRYDHYPALENSLFGPVKLIKKADIDKYKYSGYGIGFNRREAFSFSGLGFGCDVIHFGVDMSSSIHVDEKKKDILIVGEGPT